MINQILCYFHLFSIAYEELELILLKGSVNIQILQIFFLSFLGYSQESFADW
jgi:hypothetical protein